MDKREKDLDLHSGGLSARKVGGLVLVVFCIALAVVVGRKMSAEAMAVVIGVVCGVAASIPSSALLLVVLTRKDAQRAQQVEQERWQMGQDRYPPVVVIQGGTPQAFAPGTQAGYWPAAQAPPPVQRQFHVVGGDDLLLDAGRH